ncbi:MAG: hypothetical protein WCK35_27670 [Chloroflexota bacterium]
MVRSQTQLEAQPEKQRENRRSKIALRDYLELGPDRTLAKLHSTYIRAPKPPTRHLSTLHEWFAQYDWQIQAEYFDQLQQYRSQQAENEILLSGLALTSQRVGALKQLYSDLQDLQTLIWPIWKSELQSSKPAGEQRSPAQRFNLTIITYMRGVLDDLARETGGRLGRVQPASGANPQAEASIRPDLSLLTDEEFALLNDLMQKATPAQITAGSWPPGPADLPK